MSKGGAGKVYFVLYLAVILELLIIIVERDEAEEHLIRKQKEAEEIVEAVMAQLNTGFGASGVNALPQDEITLLDKSVMSGVSEKDRPKEERAYQIRVSTVKIKDILGDDLGVTEPAVIDDDDLGHDDSYCFPRRSSVCLAIAKTRFSDAIRGMRLRGKRSRRPCPGHSPAQITRFVRVCVGFVSENHLAETPNPPHTYPF